MTKTVAVFFGGKSNEREISIITGMLAVNLLRHSKYHIVPIYLLPDGGMASGDFRSPDDFKNGAKTKLIPVRLDGKMLVRISTLSFRGKPKADSRNLVRAQRGKCWMAIDCALNCCHGGIGEDGTLAALLRFHGVPFASPEVPMSAVFMDKTLTKIAARGLNIPTARSIAVHEREWKARSEVQTEVEAFGYPVVVKPAKLGSSIGIKVAHNFSELTEALDLAFRLDDCALIEEYFAGKRDINCAAYTRGGEIALSPLEEVFSNADILTFSEKYEGTGARNSKLPAELPEALAESIRTYTKTIYAAFGGRGVVRADFLVVGDRVYFNELNTVPGSLACYLFGKSLSDSRDFLVSLVEETFNAPPMPKEVLISGILEGDLFTGKGGKRR